MPIESSVQSLLNRMLDAVVIVDDRGMIRFWSTRAREILGYDPGEVLGRNVAMLMHEPDRSRHDGYLDRYMRTGSPRIIGVGLRQVYGRSRSGGAVPLELSVSEWHQGGERRFVGILRQLTDKDAAAGDLRRERDRLLRILDGLDTGVVTYQDDGEVVAVNRALLAMIGADREEVVGSRIGNLLAPECADDRFLALLTQGRLDSGSFPAVLLRRDGQRLAATINGMEAGPADEGLRCVTIKADRSTHAGSAAEPAGTLERAQRLARLGSWEWNIRSGTLWWSDEIYTIFGMVPREFEATYEAFLARVHPSDRPQVESAVNRTLETGEPYSIRHRIIQNSGNQRIVHERGVVEMVDGAPARMVGTVQDITEFVQAEEGIRQAQKMEALGHLTSGIAHDFNNLLGVIQGNLDSLKLRLMDDSRAMGELTKASAAVAKGGALTHRLLGFARRERGEVKLVDLRDSLPALVDMARRVIEERISISVVSVEIPTVIEVDPVLLENAVLNLMINSRDAMAGTGSITLGAQLFTPSETMPVKDRGREFVRIFVRDSGAGISPENLQRVFEPFFTTKPAGKGTGLGLSMVYSFAHTAGGTALVESRPGEGTEVSVVLPLARSPGAGKIRPESRGEEVAARRPNLHRGRGELILLVEDDALLLAVNHLNLEYLGYRVEVAENAAEALAKLRALTDVSVLLSDITLPGGMSGVELAMTAQAERPELRVLLASGYYAEKDNPALAGYRHLSKPFSLSQLSLTLGEVLQEGGARS